MSPAPESQRAMLIRIAREAMIQGGMEPEFPAAAMDQLGKIAAAAAPASPLVRDLRSLPWCSIDNDDSRDLDQLTVAVPGANGGVAKILTAIADVNALVPRDSPLDRHARTNTTSVYTPGGNFPMLPLRLSTDLTSLNEGVDRLAVVIEVSATESGATPASDVYPAMVRNRAKLTYAGVGGWLAGESAIPAAVSAVQGLETNLRLQDALAQTLKGQRHEHGALELQTIEVHTQFVDDAVSGLAQDKPNRARDLIENVMIAANGAIARLLEARKFPILRRVVQSPERWQRIVDLALALGEHLPAVPDAKALNEFLVRRRMADPQRFPDLSLSVIKLMGRGEYAASFPGQAVTGHFGLAVQEYTHSTAPNRRYPDLITQRLVQAALAGAAVPYPPDELVALASECTHKQDVAQKVERRTRKSAAALLLAARIGETFDGVVTGASEKGTWVRIFDPPVEGRVDRGAKGLDVGDRVRVKLVHTDAERGFIDFSREGAP